MTKSNTKIEFIKNKILLLFRVFVCLNINILLKLIFLKNKSYNNSIVFIRMDNIGDFILWLKAAEEFSKIYHDKKKILICKDTMKEFADGLNLWDEIIGIDWLNIKKNGIYRKNIIKKLINLNAEFLINVQYSKSRMLEAIVAFINAKEKYAFNDISIGLSKIERHLNKTMYTDLFNIPITIMELEKNIRFAEWVTGIKMDVKLYNFPIQKVNSFDFMKEKYFVLFPGGSYQTKSWEEKKFAALVKNICRVTNLKCFICGTKDEYKIGENIKEDNFEIINYMGKSDLYVLIEIIRNAKFLIGNDTSGIHIAAAVRTPSIVIAGGWDEGRFLNYKTDSLKDYPFYPHIVLYRKPCYGCGIRGKVGSNCKINSVSENDKKFDCINSITVDMVMKVFEKFWEVSILDNKIKDKDNEE